LGELFQEGIPEDWAHHMRSALIILEWLMLEFWAMHCRAKDLVKQLLDVQPTKRPTAAQALQHLSFGQHQQVDFGLLPHHGIPAAC